MATIETQDDYRRWKIETDLVEKLLNECEANERGILRSLGCPTAPEAIYAIVVEEQPAPWATKRKRTAERDKRRATQAMFALLWLRKARSYVQFGAENPRLAAHAALIAGAFANESTTRAIRQQQARVAGRRRGKLASADRQDTGTKVRQVAAKNPRPGDNMTRSAWHARLARILAMDHDIAGSEGKPLSTRTIDRYLKKH